MAFVYGPHKETASVMKADAVFFGMDQKKLAKKMMTYIKMPDAVKPASAMARIRTQSGKWEEVSFFFDMI